MSQEVLYRKWRPRRFADVVGQNPVVTTLRNAVDAGTPAHAYLLCGPRGTGKTTTGRILAKAVNCPTPIDGEPCDACQTCASYNENRAIDLIELDAASNRGIDEIRDLRESAGYSPAGGRYKVYLIDEVHMLTDQAFNALLKTLEEPPPHVIFILATTEQHKIPATILSRCQRFDLRRIPLDGVVARLQEIGDGEGFEVAPGGYDLIARQATGSLRDAVNLLDQLVAYHGPNLTLDEVRSGLGLIVDDRAAELARAAIAKDLAAGLTILGGVRDDGVEVRAFIREVVSVLRTTLLLKAGAEEQLGLSDTQAAELNQLAATASVSDIVAALQALTDIDFAGDAYDALPAEITFAALVTGVAQQPPVEVPAPAATPSRQQREQAAPRQAPPQQRRDAAAQPAPAQDGPPAPAAAPSQAASPAAPARAFAPPDDGEASDDLVRLRGLWDDVRAQARRAHHRAGALLSSPNNAYPRRVEGEIVEVGFQFPAHVELAQNLDGGKVLEALTEAVGAAMQRSVRVTPVLWEELGRAGSAAPAKRARSHLVEEALKQGAQPVDAGSPDE